MIIDGRSTSVTKTFATPDGRALPVLDGVSFTLAEGEIVALLGKSGSGKSTLLRCVAGLIAPTTGTVTYRGTPLTGANPGVAMVFQTFALLPWLTVQQNVELGPRGPRRSRGRAGGPGAAGRSTRSASTASSPPTRRSCPAACGSGSASPARSSPSRTRC